MGDSSEENILRAIPYPALMIDRSTLSVVALNRASGELLGLEGNDVSIGDIFPRNLREGAVDAIRRCAEGETPCVERTYVQNLKDSRLIPVEIAVGGDRSEEYILLIIRDLSAGSEESVDYIRNLYDVLSDVNKLITTSVEEKTMIRDVTRLLFRSGMFSYVAIHSLEENEPVAQEGERDPRLETLCFPIRVDKDRYGYYMVVSRAKGFTFSPIEIDLLSEIAHDIYYGLRSISAESRIRGLSRIDKLTGLPNRSAFVSFLSRAMETARNRKKSLILVVLDVDRFSDVNQAFGNAYGDELLVKVSSLIRSVVRKSDLVARTGSDEFSVVMLSGDPVISTTRLMQRLKEIFKRPITLGEHRILVTLSAGVSVFPLDAEDEKSLCANASASVHRAKAMGGNTTVFYSRSIAKASRASIRLRADLRRAIDEDEFVMYYQPKIDLSTGKVVGAEALIRWIKDGTIVPPMKFIPLIEEGELIHEVGEIVIGKVCDQVRDWSEKGISIPVALNVSPSQIRSVTFSQAISFQRDDCSSGLVEVEITESAIMDDFHRAVDFIERLSSLNIKTYIDDFGTGYSSLAYLKKLPVYAIKIDREFIKDFPSDRDSYEMVKVILTLAKTFGLKVVAEGVETEDQVKHLRDMGCDYAQGFYYSPPVPAEEFERLYVEKWS